ncbi:hypothetical protein E4U49_002467 [Claviceps purpurea]|nr:hypothetical protein E4U49_002467 [Claviceps purpurea]
MSFIRDFYSIAVYVLFYLISNTTDTQQLERYVPKFVSVVKMVPEKRGRGKATWRPRSGPRMEGKAKTQEGDPTPTVQRSDSAVVLRSMQLLTTDVA